MAESLDGRHASSNEYRRSLQGSIMSDSLRMASDYHFDPFCEVCYESRNRNIEHDGFCKDCVQFLCEDCLRVHRKLQGTWGHLIQRGDDMPKSMADKPPKFDYCDDHQQSRKDQFCCAHRVLLCSKCVPLQHKDCPVKSVDDACKGVPTSEIDTLYDKVSDIKTNLSSVVAQIDVNITELGKQQLDSLKDAQDLKDKIHTKIETLFQDMTSEIKSTYKSNKADLSRGQNILNDAIENLEGTLDDIDKLKGSTIDTKVFLKIQDILKDVDQCKSTTLKLRPSTMTVKISFNPDKRILEFLSTSLKMGSMSLDMSQPQVDISLPQISFPMSPGQSPLVSQSHSGISMPTGVSGQAATQMMPITSTKSLTKSQSHSGTTLAGASGHVVRQILLKIKARKCNSYNVKLDNDKSKFWITGMVITNDGRLLLADYRNKKIKLFSRDMKLLCSLSLSLSPWDVAITGDREAIVSCYDEVMLVIFDISDRRMSIKQTVKLPFIVRGIATYKDKLVVTSQTTSPPSVKLIDQTGRVYWSTDTDQQGQKLFYSPNYVTCYDDGGSAAVIVSDLFSHTLTVLNADTGDVITRRHVEGKYPHGVTTDTTGNIYVCYRRTGEVAVLTKDLSQEKVILSERDGLSHLPEGISYNALDNQLLVAYSYLDSENIDCFQLQ